MNNLTNFGQLWQEWEDQIIKDYYPTLKASPEMLALLPSRGKSAIRKRATILRVRADVFWEEWEDELIKSCYASPVTRPDVYKQLSRRTKEAIIGRARILKVKAIASNKPWEEWEDEIIREYYPSLSIRQQMLDKLPHRNITSIQRRASDINVLVERGYGRRTHSLDIKFFSHPNLINSYWAGFIAADGCINRNRMVVINISNKDKLHLERFCQDINYGGKIQEHISGGYTKGGMAKITISSVKLVEDLKTNFGIGERKTFSLEFPSHLSKENQIAFVAGYIDGDGAIGISSREGYSKKDFLVQMTGTEPILSKIKEMFDEYNQTTARMPRLAKIYPDKRCPRIFCYQVRGSRALPFMTSILGLCESNGVPLMKRKWDKIVEYQNLYGYQQCLRLTTLAP